MSYRQVGYGNATAQNWGGSAGYILKFGYYGLVIFNDIWKYTVVNDNPPTDEVVSANTPPIYYVSSAEAGLDGGAPAQ